MTQNVRLVFMVTTVNMNAVVIIIQHAMLKLVNAFATKDGAEMIV